jgi:hypothetical protein
VADQGAQAAPLSGGFPTADVTVCDEPNPRFCSTRGTFALSTSSMRVFTPAVAFFVVCTFAAHAAETTFDLVLRSGRVIDPESSLDAVRDVGISGGVIRMVSSTPLAGKTVVEANGLVVAPGSSICTSIRSIRKTSFSRRRMG